MKTNWPIKELDELVNIRTGKLDANKSVNDGKYPFYTCSEIPLKINETAFNGKAILIAGNGDFGVRFHRDGKFNAYQRTYVITPSAIEIDFYYLFLVLSTKIEIFKRMSQGGIIQYLRLPQLKDLEIPLPPLPIQLKIVERLDAIKKAQELNDLQISRTKELFESAVAVIFDRKDIKSSPIEYGLSEISDGNYSSKYPRSSDFVKKGIPFIRSINFKNGTISWEDMRFIGQEKHNELKKGHLKVGDILITTRGDIGKVALVSKEFNDANINAQIVRFHINKNLNERYLFYLLNSNFLQSQLTRLVTGSTLKQLSVQNLKMLKIKIPELSEQKKIVEKLDVIQNCKKLLQKQKSLLSELFDSVLNKSMNGELDS